MALIQIKHMWKQIITKTLFQDVSLQVMAGEKIGLMGLNGMGKSTLFKIILGQEALDKGEMIKKSNLHIASMGQDFYSQDQEITLYEYLQQAFQDLLQMEEEIQNLEKRMGDRHLEDKQSQQIMDRYSKLTQAFQEKGGYQYESQLRGVLQGLGFSQESMALPMKSLSGGEKSRAELGRLLLTGPELLLLDEPTNHLDLKTREWFEEYLSTYPKAVIIISHDRYFLNKTVHRLFEIYLGRLEKYPGNFNFYLQEKKRRLLYWEKEYERQKEHIQKEKEYIRRNHAGNNASQARSRKRRLELLEEIPPPPPKPPLPHIFFPYGEASSKKVLEVKGLSHSFADQTILSDINILVSRGEKIALLGDNGSGKTTLFKILLGMLSPTKGAVEYGLQVKPAFYLQEHENLISHHTLLQEALSMKGVSYQDARRVLGNLSFTEEDCEKKVLELSGGERSRLALAKLSLNPSNLLLLDEPTNHLDFLSRGQLGEAVKAYPGTCLIISHDRYFLDEVAEKIWVLEKGVIQEYPGNYSEYRKKREEKEESFIVEEKKKREKGNKRESKNPRVKEEFHGLEVKITGLEEDLEDLEKEFLKEDFYCQEGHIIQEKKKRHWQIKEELDYLYKVWEATLEGIKP